MKRKIFVYILVSFISVCFINCENHDTPTNEMQVTTCGEKNPKWLVTRVTDILKESPKYRPVRVYVYRGDGFDIIAIQDYVNSDASKALMFFDCSGNQIAAFSKDYITYEKLLQDGKFLLSWSNS